jgi:hypothetical protein
MTCAKQPARVLQNYDGEARRAQMGFEWCAAAKGNDAATLLAS